MSLSLEKIQFESLFNSLPFGIILVDKEKRVIYFNDTVEEIIGRSVKDIITINQLLSYDINIDRLIDQTIYENRVIHGVLDPLKKINLLDPFKEMQELKLDFFLSPYSPDTITTYAVISLIKKRDAQINQDSSLEQLFFMLSTIAHEIKNPLTAIKASAQLLALALKEQGSSDCINLIIKETDRLNNVLHDYLNASKKPVFNNINLHEILEVSIKLFETDLIKKNISLKRVYDLSLPDIKGDQGKLMQVFINIIKNAIDASSKKGAIEIITKLSDDIMKRDKKLIRWAVIDIKDNGVGIDNENLMNIFAPYYTNKKHGTGLGLAISKKIINDHDGMIKVKSFKDRGTTLSIYIPLA